MNRERSRRAGVLTAFASFALIALAACGSVSEVEKQDVTRVPVMSDAAAQATREASLAASPTEGEAAASPGAAEGEAAPSPGATEGESTAGEAASVTVVSHDIFFEPKELTIPANSDVTVELPNEGVTLHNFSIDELGISVDIAPGATESVVINAPEGTYEFYCNVPGHKEAGMVGTLTVSAEAAAGAGAAETGAAATSAEEPASPPAGGPESTPMPEATPVTTTAATPAVAEPAAAAAPVEVVSHDIFFEPKELTIPANTDVVVMLPNEGVTIHDFSIDELGISVAIDPGATEQVVINAPPGTYEFYCNIPGHKEAGMVGTLTVTEEAAAPPASGETAAESTPAEEPAAADSEPATPAAQSDGTPAAAAAATTPEAAGPAASAPVEVVSHDIYFEPKELTIPANTDVALTLPNEGVTLHNFSIDELGISVDQAPGETQQVVINAPPGTYEFYCNVPGHKPAGMVGTLIVE